MCGVIGLWVNDRAFPRPLPGPAGHPAPRPGFGRASSPTTAASTPKRATASSATSSRPRSIAERLTGADRHRPHPLPDDRRRPRRGRPALPDELPLRHHHGPQRQRGELRASSATTLYENHHRLLNSDNDVESILNVFAQSLEAQNDEALTPEHIFEAVEARLPEGRRQLLGRRLHRRAGHGRLPRSLRHQAPGLRVRRDGAASPTTPSPRRRSRLNLMGFGEIRDVAAGRGHLHRPRPQGPRGPAGRQAPFALPLRVGLFRPARLVHRQRQRLPRPDQPRPAPGRGDPPAEPAHRRRRARARLRPRRGHRDRPHARPEVPRGPGQEPLHRPDLHHARREEAQSSRPPEAQPDRLASSRARTSCSSTTASSAATPRRPSSRWSASAGPSRSTSPPTRRRCATPASTASTCRRGPSSWPATADVDAVAEVHRRRQGHLPDAWTT